MYHLIVRSAIIQIWRSSNGWCVTVIRGSFSSKVRYPTPGTKRWFAMFP